MTIPVETEKRLFIIGNGFDLHHWRGIWPNTSYNAFAAFLQKNKPDIFDLLTQTCLLPNDPADSLWAQFEMALADFEPEEIFEKVRDYINDTDPHEFGGAGWEAEKYIKLLTADMAESLNDFIRFGSTALDAVNYPKSVHDVKLALPHNGLYLNFNYTDTLERFYQISVSQICYIHGKAGSNSRLMIGHGVDPLGHEDEPKKEQYSEYKDLREMHGQDPWEDHEEDRYSMSENLVREEIGNYWSHSFKDSNSNIKKNKSFFDLCKNVSQVIIMGHSLSDVDLPYFEEVKCKVSQNASWEVSFYADGEDYEKTDTLLSLGIEKEKINPFRLQDCIVTSRNA